VQQGDDVGDLGGVEQATETDDLVGDAGVVQCLDDRVELRSLAAQDRCRSPLGPREPAPEPVDDVSRLVLEGLQAGCADLARPGIRPLGQRLDRHPGGRGERTGDRVGRGEHGAVVAPARGQVQHPGGLGIGEVVAEPVERRGRRAAPAVDGLVRVAHRGDGNRLPRRDEERVQQLQLGLGGVLELVEQHGPEAQPLGATHLRHRAGDAGGESHLVGEVHGVARALQLLVALEDGHHRGALAQHADQVAHRVGPLTAAGALGERLEGFDDGVEVGGEADGVDEVFGELAGEVDDGGRDRGLRLVDDVHRAVPRDDGLVGELPGRGLGEQPAVGFDPHPQPVLAHDPAGIRVVGGDRRDVVEHHRTVLGRRGPDAGLAQRGQPGRQPLGQLARGLAGEGEAEHLVGAHEVVGDEPHHAGRHRLGLPGPGPGHDQKGPQRRLDDRHLLGRRLVGLSECLGEGDGRPARRGCGVGAHSCRPSGCAGQESLTWQVPHCAPGVAVKLAAAIASAVTASSS
jgi:hypothetical protein